MIIDIVCLYMKIKENVRQNMTKKILEYKKNVSKILEGRTVTNYV